MGASRASRAEPRAAGGQHSATAAAGAAGATREASSAEDSDATARSSSEEASQPSSRPKNELQSDADQRDNKRSAEDDTRDAACGKPEDGVAGTNKRRRRPKSGDASQPDGLLRLAQIAHAAPQLPASQREGAGAGVSEAEHNGADVPAPTAKDDVGYAPATSQEAAAAAAPGPAVPTDQLDQKITVAQVRALANAGQLGIPGYTPVPCPYVQPGARWQLDLRTGERLDDLAAAQYATSLPALQASSAMPGGAGAQHMGPRPPIFTASGPQGAQMPPPGGYGLVPPPHSFAGSLPIQALGQQAGPQGGSSAGPFTALLGPQMQPLLPHGVLQPGQYPASFAGTQQVSAIVTPGVPPKKRQRSNNAAELAELPEIPLRRRGRPAGDGAAAASSPHELQERRMQANRAAASRSHFRRKREMEVLEKECTVLEARGLELRASIANLMAQEEALRLQQAGIREHLAVGCRTAQGEPSAQQHRDSGPSGGLAAQAGEEA